MINKVLNIDCMEYMKEIPDNWFELAIVDPPYGIERFKKGSLRFDKSTKAKDGLKWDKKPSPEYFNELFRVSKNQIVWCANNFSMPESEYFIIWDKKQTVDNFASAEYAWTNYKKPAQIYHYSIHQCMSDRKAQGGKIHPTQKPVSLYKWLLKNYAKPNDKILDTHIGSGSIRIACHDMGFELHGCELDKDYFEAQEERFKNHIKQAELFEFSGGLIC